MVKTLKEKKQAKVEKIMSEFGKGKLHAGKNGKIVKSQTQALAISLSIAKKIKK